MWRLRRFLFRLLNVVRAERLEREVTREIRAHLTLIEDEFQRHGLSAEEARLMARRTLGGIDQIKEQHRDARSFQWLDDTEQDLRYGWRALKRAPGFAAAAVLTLALGIGANTAIFTLIDALLLRPLPVREPQQLVQLTMTLPEGEVWQSFSYPLVRALAEQRNIFSALGGFSGATFNVGSSQNVQATTGAWVTGHYYETLGLTPAAGRLLIPEDDRPGAIPVVVISDDYWRRQFGRDPQVIGRPLMIAGSAVAIANHAFLSFACSTTGWITAVTWRTASCRRVDSSPSSGGCQ
jgi:putative ABC transport system permease protein